MPSARKREDSATEMKTAISLKRGKDSDEESAAKRAPVAGWPSEGEAMRAGALNVARMQRCGKSAPAGSRDPG